MKPNLSHTDRAMRRVMRKARQVVASDRQSWADFAASVAGVICPSRALIAGAVRVRCSVRG